jgi:Flp pilus assembly protein TadD
MAPSPSRTFPLQNIAARRRNGHATARVLPRVARHAKHPGQTRRQRRQLSTSLYYISTARSAASPTRLFPELRRGQATVTAVTDFLASRLLILNSVDFKRQFRAACGYAELGMAAESIAELNAIEDEYQHRPEVLQLRLHHLMRKKQWSRALTVSRRLCRAAPEASAGYLHAGFCLHQIGRTREAKELLLGGPTALLKEPIYYYNMGCYEVLLGNLKDARVHLQISFKMDSSFRDLAKRDPDLRPLHETL